MSHRNASDTQAMVGVGASFAVTTVFGLAISCLLSVSGSITASDASHAPAPVMTSEQYSDTELAWNGPSIEIAAHREVSRW